MCVASLSALERDGTGDRESAARTEEEAPPELEKCEAGAAVEGVVGADLGWVAPGRKGGGLRGNGADRESERAKRNQRSSALRVLGATSWFALELRLFQI